MKEAAGISNHNLIRNSNAYMSSGSKIDQIFHFRGLMIHMKKTNKNSIGILNFRFRKQSFINQCGNSTRRCLVDDFRICTNE